MKKCLNCGRECDSAFCPDCGQSMDTGRITIASFSKLTASSMSKVDGGLIRTTKRLLKSPLIFIRDYLKGHRIGYTNPVVMIIAFALIASVADSFLSMGGITPEKPRIAAESESDPMIGVIFEWVFENPVILAILAVFPAIVAAKIAFRKYGISRYNMGEMLIAALYVMALGSIVDILLIPVEILDHFLNVGFYTLTDVASSFLIAILGFMGICRACPVEGGFRKFKVYSGFLLTVLSLIMAISLLLILIIVLISLLFRLS